MENFALVDLSSKSQDIPLTQNEFTIGRGLDNCKVIADVSISRTHCIIKLVEGKWYLFDKSFNGTFLNGTKLNKSEDYKLSDGDIIIINDSIKFMFKKALPQENTTNKDLLEQNDLMNLVDSAALNVKILEAEFNKYGNPDKQNLVCPVNQESSTSTNYENLPNNLNSESTILKMSKSPVDQAGTTSKTDSEQPQQNFNVQEELQCSICTEMFVKAVTLSCSHTFCQYCIKQWQKNKVVCPICRARTTSSCRTLILDSFIERVIKDSSKEIQEHRRKLLEERETIAKAPVKTPAKRKPARRAAAEPVVISSDEDSSTDEEDEPDYVFDFENDYTYEEEWEGIDYVYEDYNGLPGEYYGGYGHCYACGQAGHWANGCPKRRRR